MRELQGTGTSGVPRDDYATARIIAAALAVRVGLIIVYDEAYQRYRLFQDGQFCRIATLSELLSWIFATVDERLVEGRD